MASRYKLRSFTAADTPSTLLQDISPPGNGLSGSLGSDGAAPWHAVVETLRALKAQSLLIQRGVRDPDFLEEHHAFYSRQHRPVARTCVRVHVFSDPTQRPEATEAIPEVLDFLDRAVSSKSYLGFVTIRPLRHAPVGATILKAPPGRRAKAKDTFPVHIAGHEFEVSGTPFLQQDNAVGACAQASIWMALRTLRRRQGNAAFSPAELTVAATRYLAFDRTFPGRGGLTIHQMLEAIRFAGHDPLHLSIPPQANGAADVAEVLAAIGPYLESGLPVVIALLAPGGGHAVVAIGQEASPTQVRNLPRLVNDRTPTSSIALSYEHSSSWCNSLTIHNDNSGPYLELVPAATAHGGYALEQVTGLIIPLPDGIFMTAAEAEVLAVRYLTRVSILFTSSATGTPALPTVAYVLRAVLVSRHAFRTWAKADPGMDPAIRLHYRTHELPHYLWVVEIHDAAAFNPDQAATASRRGEIVLDAAADPLHADGLIFAAVSAALWPAITTHAGILLIEHEHGHDVVGLTTAFRGQRIVRSW